MPGRRSVKYSVFKEHEPAAAGQSVLPCLPVELDLAEMNRNTEQAQLNLFAAT